MRILFDYRIQTGGINCYSRYIITMLNELYGARNVTLLVNENVHDLPNPVLITKLRAYSFCNFFRWQTKGQFDYYFSPSYHFFNVAARKRFMVVHDLAVLLDKNYFSNNMIRAVGLTRWKLYFYMLNLFDFKIFAISHTTINDVVKCWNVPSIGLLENVISVNKAYPAEYNFIKQQKSVLYFGNSRKHKNIERIFNLAKQYPHIQFKFSGMCCDDSRLEWHLVNVQRLGFLDECALGKALRNVDASILLSTYEGFGRGVVESLLHGTPAIINRAGALQELHDNGIISLEKDEDFEIALDRAQFVKEHNLINKKYWTNQHSYKRIKAILKDALEC